MHAALGLASDGHAHVRPAAKNYDVSLQLHCIALHVSCLGPSDCQVFLIAASCCHCWSYTFKQGQGNGQQHSAGCQPRHTPKCHSTHHQPRQAAAVMGLLWSAECRTASQHARGVQWRPASWCKNGGNPGRKQTQCPHAQHVVYASSTRAASLLCVVMVVLGGQLTTDQQHPKYLARRTHVCTEDASSLVGQQLSSNPSIQVLSLQACSAA